ncbi:geranyltranstransferase [Tepiditoga spiralis]|uniref:Geranyltranstransferase n=1 Tax=Tepiditoga spiralis TaxID=2108365 RepID=A0A7G1GBS5_9BACT|nr:polyprenyl synthetase family protein [Tepiditoga spiralis]BBE31942.1 geranyltranstransferase [Tepiditoga spiralis]
MENFKKEFNNYIKLYFENNNIENKYFRESLFYSMINGGKRLRPWIINEIGKFLDIDKNILLDIGLAVEILHTSSLIHDDLPSIDNSNLRRGKLSNHMRFDVHTAILSGDYGFIVPNKIILNLPIEDNLKIKVLDMFLSTSLKLFSGEMNDVAFEKYSLNPTLDEIIKMYEYKTGVMFGFSFAAPFLIVNDSKKAKKFYEVGVKFGLAFQLFDDLKDLKGNSKILGKDVNKDINKLTALKLLGVTKTEEKSNEFFNSCIKTLNEYKMNNFSEKLISLKKLIQER